MEEKDQRPCCQTKRISRTEETLSSAAATSLGGFGTTSRRSPARRWFCSSVRFLGPHRALAFLVLISWYSVLVRCFAVGAGHQCGFGPAPGSSTRTKQARIQHHGPRRRHNNYNYYYYYHTSGLSTLSTATGSIPAGEEENEEQTEGLAAIRGGDSYNEEYYSTNPWPAFDKLDKRLVKISLPVIANYAINPMIGAVDLFWVNRMGKPLAVAGQAAANQGMFARGSLSSRFQYSMHTCYLSRFFFSFQFCVLANFLPTERFGYPNFGRECWWEHAGCTRCSLQRSFCWCLHGCSRVSSVTTLPWESVRFSPYGWPPSTRIRKTLPSDKILCLHPVLDISCRVLCVPRGA